MILSPREYILVISSLLISSKADWVSSNNACESVKIAIFICDWF